MYGRGIPSWLIAGVCITVFTWAIFCKHGEVITLQICTHESLMTFCYTICNIFEVASLGYFLEKNVWPPFACTMMLPVDQACNITTILHYYYPKMYSLLENLGWKMNHVMHFRCNASRRITATKHTVMVMY